MNPSRTYWRTHWNNLHDAGHRHNERSWVEFYAHELMLYFPLHKTRVIDLGCGTGTLYAAMSDHFASYVGIDFSPSMLREFSLAWPQVRLICGDIADLPIRTDAGQYDFCFSNQVCQYLSEDALSEHMSQVYHLLEGGGTYLIGNIPDRHLRLFHYAGLLRPDIRMSWLSFARRISEVFLLKRDDGIGYWHTRRTVHDIALRNGFSCRTFSSASYEYRFHALLQKNEPDDH
ncbi:MAG: class I SAM-dependent methyltransferase [Chloroflexales bacterium]